MQQQPEERDLTGRCPKCLMRFVLCICAEIPRVETRTHFVILRHKLEAMKATNTARMAHLAMPNSELVDYGGRAPVDLDALTPEGTWLLYPEGEGAPLSEGKPSRVLVLDGNWPQTRRMLHRLPRLRQLPRLTLKPRASDRLRMRKQQTPEGMSTLEAIAAAVTLLESEEQGAALDRFYDGVTERVMRARGLLK